ncbi:MAG: hypothetical protein VB031_06930 [Eubacteriaceae bacterium]|nr:hypothetical protein [Eubacteriaceae bacterium]
MEKLKSLSKREIVLIYILLIVIIVAVGVMFLIKPAVSKADKIENEYQEAKITAMKMKTSIAGKDDTQLEIKEYEKKIKNAKRHYRKNMKTEKVDELLTGMIKTSGLTPEKMTIDGEGASSSADGTGAGGTANTNTNTGDATTDSTIDAGNTNGSTAADQNTEQNTDKDTAGQYEYVKVDTASASATGTISECIGLIENARKTVGVRVAAFQISAETASDQSEISGYTAGETGTKAAAADTVKTKSSTGYTIEISFEIYELKDI